VIQSTTLERRLKYPTVMAIVEPFSSITVQAVVP
jgi:hypothetical protein